MILLLPNDLINENNFGKIYDLIDSACLGIEKKRNFKKIGGIKRNNCS